MVVATMIRKWQQDKDAVCILLPRSKSLAVGRIGNAHGWVDWTELYLHGRSILIDTKGKDPLPFLDPKETSELVLTGLHSPQRPNDQTCND
jgi:hypothetical protein